MNKLYRALMLIRKIFCGREDNEDLRETIEAMVDRAMVIKPIAVNQGDTLVLSCPQRLREDVRGYLVDSMKKFIDKKTSDVDVVILEDGMKISGVIKHGSDARRTDVADFQPR